MFQPAFFEASPEPSGFWGVYSYSNFEKFNVTFSVRRSSPPLPPVLTDDTIQSESLILMYSRGLSPALRTVSSASPMCLPEQHWAISAWLALSMYLVNDISCTFTLPE